MACLQCRERAEYLRQAKARFLAGDLVGYAEKIALVINSSKEDILAQLKQAYNTVETK